MKRRFKIPLSPIIASLESCQSIAPEDTLEYAMSDTYILDTSRIELVVDVEVVRPQWRQYRPHPLYRVIQILGGRNRKLAQYARAVRLSIIPVGGFVFLERPVRREQIVCTDESGLKHVVKQQGFSEIRRLCCPDDERVKMRELEVGKPTCPTCLKKETVWVEYCVQPYKHPREAEKKLHKARVKARIYARYSTAFERIANDWLEG